MSPDETLFSIDEFINNGQTLFNMGLYRDLANICNEFLGENEDDRVYSMLASAEFSLGDVNTAEKSARAGLKVNPKNPDLLYNLACILQEKGLLSNALRYFARAENIADDEELIMICQNEISGIESALGKGKDDIIPVTAKKRVLIIAGVYPPLSGSGVQRTVKLVKYLRFYGWEPVVIAPDTGKSPVLLGNNYFDELPDDIKVLRIPVQNDITVSDLDYMLNRISPLVSDTVKKQLQLLYDKLNHDMRFSLLSFPEPLVLWANRIADKLHEYVDVNNIDVVYTTSAPYSDHIAGYYIKEKYNIPWVADFRDEWSGNPFIWPDREQLHYKMCVDCEQSFFGFANHVVFVTERSCENAIELGLPNEKVSCITNGYDEEDFEWFDGVAEKNEKFTIIHNGLLYNEKKAATILEALSNLIARKDVDSKKIVFHTGNIPGIDNKENLEKEISKFGMEKVAFFTPYMEHHDCIAHAATADLLLVILGASIDYAAVYTGKIFEYLRLGLPILNLGPPGALDNLLKKTGHGVTVDFSNIKGIENEILRYYKLWHKNNVKGLSSSLLLKQPSDISTYERKNLTRKHAEIFDKLITET